MHLLLNLLFVTSGGLGNLRGHDAMCNISEEKRRYIEYLLGKELDELYVLVAQSEPAFSDRMFSPEEARTKGEAHVNSLLDPLRRKICKEWNYCNRRHDPNLADTVTLVATVSDLILSVVGGIPATMIAVVMAKKGLNTFCECDSNE